MWCSMPKRTAGNDITIYRSQSNSNDPSSSPWCISIDSHTTEYTALSHSIPNDHPLSMACAVGVVVGVGIRPKEWKDADRRIRWFVQSTSLRAFGHDTISRREVCGSHLFYIHELYDLPLNIVQCQISKIYFIDMVVSFAASEWIPTNDTMLRRRHVHRYCDICLVVAVVRMIMLARDARMCRWKVNSFSAVVIGQWWF